MSKKTPALHDSGSQVYTVDNGKRKFIVTPVYKEAGENIGELLMRLICDDDNTVKSA